MHPQTPRFHHQSWKTTLSLSAAARLKVTVCGAPGTSCDPGPFTPSVAVAPPTALDHVTPISSLRDLLIKDSVTDRKRRGRQNKSTRYDLDTPLSWSPWRPEVL